jgi:hypothetical protein
MALAAFLVALLALVVAGWSAFSARRSANAAELSAENAFMSRSDQLAPSVRIEPQPIRERFMVDDRFPRQPPGVTAPRQTEFILPSQENVRNLLGAYLDIRNEGSATATVTFDAFRVDRCSSFDEVEEIAVKPRPAELPNTDIDSKRLSLRPGSNAGVIVRAGPTVGEWAALGHDTPVVMRITGEASPDGARQVWLLTLTGALLQPKYGDASHFLTMPHSLPELQLQELPREYPTRVHARRPSQLPWRGTRP